MQHMERIVENYLRRIARNRETGTATGELTHYAALEELINAVGHDLKPKVFCVSQIANQGAGHPDFGLFTANQCQKGEPKPGILPERGVVEVKKVTDDTWLTADTQQISKYWKYYRLVLVTNYRDFLLIGEDSAGKAAKLESFSLAKDAVNFWERCARAKETSEEVGNVFGEYLRRVLSHAATLRDPKDVAFFLASYARDALGRVKAQGNLPALALVRTALEQALGVKFQGERGDAFFRSTLVQTLFYGIFSAWVLWSRQTQAPSGLFDWRTAVWHLRVPMIRSLFGQLAMPDKLQPLGLVEVLDWAAAALSRVDRTDFFARFRDSHAVQYFYEPFLEAFDPALKKELGVWYTPPEVVSYMVERVDQTLRDDLGVSEGLAGENVYVLDPCTGTGSFIVEVLRHISRSLDDRGLGALKGHAVKKAARERVFGFEIMPAPFVVAHLQVSVLLQSLDAPLSEDGTERAGVYLTNALTGWEPERDKPKLPFAELQEERDKAAEVKQEKPILVILGNPPYNGFAGMAIEEERTLTEAYRTATSVRQPEGQGLNDLYVRFFRMAERRITEKTGQGIVCLITNYSWLDGLSFTGMRERYLKQFDAIRIDCLNGDKYKTGKVAPDGSPDPSIFSTDHNKEGIQVGTAIATLVRKVEHVPASEVQSRHLWGRNKTQQLMESATAEPKSIYLPHVPQRQLGLPFLPAVASKNYFLYPRLTELFPVSFPGVKTSRDNFLVDIDQGSLRKRIAMYFDKSISHDEIRRSYPAIMTNSGRFKSEDVRSILLNRGMLSENIIRYHYRPFDVRWIYWEPDTKLLDEKREKYRPHIFRDNLWLEAREKQTKEEFNRGDVTKHIADNMGNGLSNFFPMYLRDDHDHGTGDVVNRRPNVNRSVGEKLEALGVGVEDLFYHVVAVLHTPTYRTENAGALRMDWPRIPLPEAESILRGSAKLGRQLADLLDPEKPVPGVTAGTPRPEMRGLAVVNRVGGGHLSETDMSLTAGWGHLQRGEIVMPGQGLVVERPYTKDEIQAIEAGAEGLNLDVEHIFKLIGRTTTDIYLNKNVYWANIPSEAWKYNLGGYQVIKKWLSYREHSVIGRNLHADELHDVTKITRRITAILLLSDDLNRSFGEIS